MLRDALLDQAWVLTRASMVQVIIKYIRVWDLQLGFALTETPDHFI
jgi:hypothetical protein